jgi:hypothetical protein
MHKPPARRHSKVVPGRRGEENDALDNQQQHAVGIREAGRTAGLRVFLRYWSW